MVLPAGIPYYYQERALKSKEAQARALGYPGLAPEQIMAERVGTLSAYLSEGRRAAVEEKKLGMEKQYLSLAQQKYKALEKQAATQELATMLKGGILLAEAIPKYGPELIEYGGKAIEGFTDLIESIFSPFDFF